MNKEQKNVEENLKKKKYKFTTTLSSNAIAELNKIKEEMDEKYINNVIEKLIKLYNSNK